MDETRIGHGPHSKEYRCLFSVRRATGTREEAPVLGAVLSAHGTFRLLEAVVMGRFYSGLFIGAGVLLVGMILVQLVRWLLDIGHWSLFIGH